VLCVCNICPVSSFYLDFTYNFGPFTNVTIYYSSVIAYILCILYPFFQIMFLKYLECSNLIHGYISSNRKHRDISLRTIVSDCSFHLVCLFVL
jgi:hypothetical protein